MMPERLDTRAYLRALGLAVTTAALYRQTVVPPDVRTRVLWANPRRQCTCPFSFVKLDALCENSRLPIVCMEAVLCRIRARAALSLHPGALVPPATFGYSQASLSIIPLRP